MNEKSYKFKIQHSGKEDDFTEYLLKESQLEEKHENMLLGQLLKDLEHAPQKVQQRFISRIINSFYNIGIDPYENLETNKNNDTRN